MIKIRGNGEAAMAPDAVEIQFILERRDRHYEQVVQASHQQLEQLASCLAGEGTLLTTNFTVDTELETVKSPNGEFTNVVRGYVARHYLTLELNLNPDVLDRVLQKISQCQAQPLLTIRYKVKDSQHLMNLALQAAFKDALMKANVLAEASGVKLGTILEINHEEFSVFRGFSTTTAEVQPAEISTQTWVLVTWELI